MFVKSLLPEIIILNNVPERPNRYAELAKDLAIGIKVNNALLFECFLLFKKYESNININTTYLTRFLFTKYELFMRNSQTLK